MKRPYTEGAACLVTGGSDDNINVSLRTYLPQACGMTRSLDMGYRGSYDWVKFA